MLFLQQQEQAVINVLQLGPDTFQFDGGFETQDAVDSNSSTSTISMTYQWKIFDDQQEIFSSSNKSFKYTFPVTKSYRVELTVTKVSSAPSEDKSNPPTTKISTATAEKNIESEKPMAFKLIGVTGDGCTQKTTNNTTNQPQPFINMLAGNFGVDFSEFEVVAGGDEAGKSFPMSNEKECQIDMQITVPTGTSISIYTINSSGSSTIAQNGEGGIEFTYLFNDSAVKSSKLTFTDENLATAFAHKDEVQSKEMLFSGLCGESFKFSINAKLYAKVANIADQSKISLNSLFGKGNLSYFIDSRKCMSSSPSDSTNPPSANFVAEIAKEVGMVLLRTVVGEAAKYFGYQALDKLGIYNAKSEEQYVQQAVDDIRDMQAALGAELSKMHQEMIIGFNAISDKVTAISVKLDDKNLNDLIVRYNERQASIKTKYALYMNEMIDLDFNNPESEANEASFKRIYSILNIAYASKVSEDLTVIHDLFCGTGTTPGIIDFQLQVHRNEIAKWAAGVVGSRNKKLPNTFKYSGKYDFESQIAPYYDSSVIITEAFSDNGPKIFASNILPLFKSILATQMQAMMFLRAAYVNTPQERLLETHAQEIKDVAKKISSYYAILINDEEIHNTLLQQFNNDMTPLPAHFTEESYDQNGESHVQLTSSGNANWLLWGEAYNLFNYTRITAILRPEPLVSFNQYLTAAMIHWSEEYYGHSKAHWDTIPYIYYVQVPFLLKSPDRYAKMPTELSNLVKNLSTLNN